MNAIVYMIIRQYANRVRRIFKKPMNAILTVIATVFIVAGPVLMLIMPGEFTGMVGLEGREIVIAGVQLFISITLILSALSQQGGLFSYSEANILFSSPFSKRDILLYSTLSTLPASVLTALFMCFYFPFILGGVITIPKLLATLLVMSLLVFCIYILYYLIYIQDIAHPGLKKKLKKYAYISFAVIIVIYALIWSTNGYDFGDAAITFFTSHIYNAFPLFGWAKWAVAALLNGDIITGFIPATLLLAVASYVLARIYYSQDVDFFEKAQLDAIQLQKVVDNLKSGGYDASGVTIAKVRKAKCDFKPGAAAILSRQFLEMKKKGQMLTFKDFINGAIYIAVGLAAGLEYEFVYIMILFSLITNTASDNWNAEFSKPYMYLIPESSIKKLMYAVLPSLIKTVLNSSIIVISAAALYGVSAFDTFFYLMMLISYIFLFTSAGVFTYRIMGRVSNAILLMFMRVLFVMACVIPGVILVVVLHVAIGITGISGLVIPMAFVNIACSLLFMLLSRNLLEQSEIMS